MKIAIDCVHYPISKSVASHRASWARYWKWYLQTKNPKATIHILGRNDHTKWQDYDEVYFYQGMEWNGSLNLAGGVSDYTLERMRTYAKTKFKKVFSIEVDMPNYYELMKNRKVDDPTLKENHKPETVTMPQTDNIVLGDSHSLSVMDSDGKFVKVYRTDFKTLYSALETGIKNVQDIDWSKVKQVTLFFGMIDLRHHIMRHGGIKIIDDIIDRYEDQLIQLSKEGVKIELVEMYAMTKDSRKLPKSGYYKGTPFCGSLQDRIDAVNYFNSLLKALSKRRGFKFYEQPEIFIEDNGTMDDWFMERPRSVHMSSEFYRFDLEKGKTREW